MLDSYGEGLSDPCPNHTPYLEGPFLHSQPEDAPHHGEKEFM